MLWKDTALQTLCRCSRGHWWHEQGVISRRESDLFSFSLPQATNDTQPYRLLLLLRTVDGDAQLGTSPVPDTIGTQVYSTEVTTEVVIEIPWFVIAQNPGRYLVSISRARRRSIYTLQLQQAFAVLRILRQLGPSNDSVLLIVALLSGMGSARPVETPLNDVMLAEPDLTAVKDLHTACCVEGGATSSLCTQFLPRALAPSHSPDDDLCRMTPMACNSDGRLTQLAVAQAGLICPRGLPASLSQLGALVTLDLAFNYINMTAAEVAQIIGPMPALQNAFLRYTGIDGPLSCDLVANPSLTRLSLSGNNVTGSLPPCMLQDPTLQELYLSQTGLSGALPDVVPANSPLRLLYAINFIQPERTGFTGPLPPSLLSSPSLAYLNLANNALSGSLGQLPATLRTLNVSNNALAGRITELPPSLAVLDVGTNEFTGGLPAIPETLRYLGAANNSLAGTLPALPPSSQLRFMYAQNNRLTGGLPPSLVDGRAPLLLLDLHNNRLTGQLDDAAAAGSGRGSSGGRRLLQQQQGGADAEQQAGAGGGGVAGGGGAWSFDTLALLDLSGNGFSGPVPASLGGLQGLSYLDLSSNALTGSLAPYADALAANASQSALLHLNLSSNRLAGEVPAALAAAPMLDPQRLNGRRSAGVPRVLDLSGNTFEGAFPTGLVSQAEAAQAACSNMCSVRVLLGGPDMALACPGELTVSAAQLEFLQQADYVCRDGSGQQQCWHGIMLGKHWETALLRLRCLLTLVSLRPCGTAARQPSWSALGCCCVEVSLLAAASLPESSDQPGSATVVSGQPFTTPTRMGATAARRPPAKQQLSPGAIAGIVIGSVAGAALLAGAAVFGYKMTKRHRWAGAAVFGCKKTKRHRWAGAAVFGCKKTKRHRWAGAAVFGCKKTKRHRWAGAAVFGCKKTKRHRWAGAAVLAARRPRGTGLPPASTLAAPPAAAAAGATNGVNGASPGRGVRFSDAAGDPAYPHTPYERSQAGIEMLSNRHNEV
ncbi:hypothetical protein COO60DRAFT_1463034 [Scenedesmus sp. NREL 46B-D3]|nr:hypothetical protein COO60DRAFT_1463034 [Scenedesmus sp. NREL 46B-D3]